MFSCKKFCYCFGRLFPKRKFKIFISGSLTEPVHILFPIGLHFGVELGLCSLFKTSFTRKKRLIRPWIVICLIVRDMFCVPAADNHCLFYFCIFDFHCNIMATLFTFNSSVGVFLGKISPLCVLLKMQLPVLRFVLRNKPASPDLEFPPC